MKFIAISVFGFLAATSIASGESIRLESSQGILIPAPIAHSLRFSRGAYSSSSPSYAAPAHASSYSAPAASYSAPAAPAAPSHASYVAPPCSVNYLFSCQPSLSPVACSSSSNSYGGAAAPSSYAAPSASHSAPSSSYGASSPSYSAPAASHGAYSNPVPQYAVPYVKELY